MAQKKTTTAGKTYRRSGILGRRAGSSRDSSGRQSGSSRDSSGRKSSGRGSSRYSSGRQGSTSRSSSARARRRRRNENMRFLLTVTLLLLLIACLGGTLFLYHNGTSQVPDVSVDLEQLDSPYAVLMDRETGTILASKRGTEQMYPASLTKIMTVLVALDEFDDLDQTVTMSYDYFQDLYARDASRAGFEPGEEAKIIDLMYGAILPSGAECCMELAIQSAGSESAFVDLMNRKAEKLGLTGTHFANSTGLHDSEQYSTAEDFAALLREALKNDTFYEIITSRYHYVQPTNLHSDGFTFYGTMFKNMEDASVAGGQIMGGKTGYTDEAGHCLASFATVDGRDYILVTAGIPETARTTQYHIDDAFRAYGQISSEN